MINWLFVVACITCIIWKTSNTY